MTKLVRATALIAAFICIALPALADDKAKQAKPIEVLLDTDGTPQANVYEITPPGSPSMRCITIVTEGGYASSATASCFPAPAAK
ncbi:MAG: hypothetical protein P4M15_09755 [Alphaproteobacteria bacterium]|nr:hypothetical protein [Alphaproteobacteria bacterium]